MQRLRIGRALSLLLTWLIVCQPALAADCNSCQNGGPCMANVRYWGYYPTQWRRWPGTEPQPEAPTPAPPGTPLPGTFTPNPDKEFESKPTEGSSGTTSSATPGMDAGQAAPKGNNPDNGKAPAVPAKKPGQGASFTPESNQFYSSRNPERAMPPADDAPWYAGDGLTTAAGPRENPLRTSAPIASSSTAVPTALPAPAAQPATAPATQTPPGIEGPTAAEYMATVNPPSAQSVAQRNAAPIDRSANSAIFRGDVNPNEPKTIPNGAPSANPERPAANPAAPLLNPERSGLAPAADNSPLPPATQTQFPPINPERTSVPDSVAPRATVTSGPRPMRRIGIRRLLSRRWIGCHCAALQSRRAGRRIRHRESKLENRQLQPPRRPKRARPRLPRADRGPCVDSLRAPNACEAAPPQTAPAAPQAIRAAAQPAAAKTAAAKSTITKSVAAPANNTKQIELPAGLTLSPLRDAFPKARLHESSGNANAGDSIEHLAADDEPAADRTAAASAVGFTWSPLRDAFPKTNFPSDLSDDEEFATPEQIADEKSPADETQPAPSQTSAHAVADCKLQSAPASQTPVPVDAIHDGQVRQASFEEVAPTHPAKLSEINPLEVGKSQAAPPALLAPGTRKPLPEAGKSNSVLPAAKPLSAVAPVNDNAPANIPPPANVPANWSVPTIGSGGASGGAK